MMSYTPIMKLKPAFVEVCMAYRRGHVQVGNNKLRCKLTSGGLAPVGEPKKDIGVLAL
jgi:hypothetical protein